jgi:hypothetical protein
MESCVPIAKGPGRRSLFSGAIMSPACQPWEPAWNYIVKTAIHSDVDPKYIQHHLLREGGVSSVWLQFPRLSLVSAVINPAYDRPD